MARLFGLRKSGGAIAVTAGTAIALLVFLGGCGSSLTTSTGANSPSPQFDPAVNEPSSDSAGPSDQTTASVSEESKKTSLEDLIYSNNYTGYLVVHFDDDLAVRLFNSKSGQTLYSAKKDTGNRLDPIRKTFSAFSEIELEPTSKESPEEVDRARAYLEHLSGKTLVNWNSIFHIKVQDPKTAVQLMNELKKQNGVAKVYPGMRGHLTSIDTTPSLAAHQSYLLDEQNHGGLNANAAWQRSVKGEDVTVIDNEPGVNFDHEDLGLTARNFLDGGNYLYEENCAPGFASDEYCEPFIAHGTAVAGILVAEDNNHGITGFAPNARYLNAPMKDDPAHDLILTTDGVLGSDPTALWSQDIEPGSIWIFEVAMSGRLTPAGCHTDGVSVDNTANCSRGEVPVELWPDVFAAIQQAEAYGVTVIEGAGNGEVDLGDPGLYADESWSFAHNMATEDSGAIMVGASGGPEERKAAFSNYGRRINTFAWGFGVATTAYPYGQYTWNGTVPPAPLNSAAEPNNYYTDNFGGTSSAAAMVAGAAVLVQSHARKELGNKRYLMPGKMREILVSTGVPQRDASCNQSSLCAINIGRQPRVDAALNAVDAFLQQKRAEYPELMTGKKLTEEKMLALRSEGIGVICAKADPETHTLPGFNDPICPESDLWPTGVKIAKDLDFDGDGKADLVWWTNGGLKIDLWAKGIVNDYSSVPKGSDNFGSFDVEITYPPIEGKWVWPYVIDMNSDGRSDLVVYDKEHGKFYIAFTDNALLNGTWHGWDTLLDYSSVWKDELNIDPKKSHYSRPILGDYDADGWVDIAIAAFDGTSAKMMIDFGGRDKSDFGKFELIKDYLTRAQIALAPGWAYPVATYTFYMGSDLTTAMVFKVPDGLPEEGKVFFPYTDGSVDTYSNLAHMYGGNEDILMPGAYSDDGFTGGGDLGIKKADGSWPVSLEVGGSAHFQNLQDIAPSSGYGDSSCHPIAADFDGDGLTDRAVMCPDEWRIAYSGSEGLRIIPLGYDTDIFTLPGRSYSGGISYGYALELISLFQELHPGVPPPIPVDMVTPRGSQSDN